MAFVAPSSYFNLSRLGSRAVRAPRASFTAPTRFFNPARSAATARPIIQASFAPQSNAQTSGTMSAMSFMRADLDHIALDCKGDALALVDFYVSVFNFQPYRVDAFKVGNAPFPSVRTSPNTILDFFKPEEDAPTPPKGLRQNNHFCFAVTKEDWDALRNRLQDKGVDTMGPPSKRSGARGDGTSIYVKDPEGNVVEFRYYDDDAKPEDS